MRILDNGIYRDMTKEEVAEYIQEQEAPADALTEMIIAMSNATTVAQMRESAKVFLERTGGVE